MTASARPPEVLTVQWCPECGGKTKDAYFRRERMVQYKAQEMDAIADVLEASVREYQAER